MLYLLTVALLFALSDAKGIKRALPKKLLKKNIQHKPQTKIVNGQPTTNSAYPWIVSLRIIGYDENDEYLVDGSHFCGGSIIEMGDVPIILTAAHCVDGMQKTLKQYEKDMKKETGDNWEFNVYADIGRTNIKPYDIGTYDRIEVTNWYQHQDYDSDDVINDIAIIALDDSIDTSKAPNATTVSYTDQPTLTDGEMLRVIGYGLNISSDISDNAGYTPTLEYTNISYVEAALCNQYQNLFLYIDDTEGAEGVFSYNWSNPDFSVLDDWSDYDSDIIRDGMICGYDVDSDSCQGDSGGPVVNLPLTKDATQIGVVSWGYGCAWGVPGVYSSVDYFLDWVEGARSCLSCTADDDDNSLSYCKKTYTNCSDWVKEYGKPVDRYSSGSNHNSDDVIIIVVVILAIALVCGVIVCLASYIRRRRKQQNSDELYTSLTGNQEMTHGNI